MATECDCPQCQGLCRHEPGWFLPTEIDPAAAFLHLTTADFVREWLAEHRQGDVLVLAPRVKPGTTECVFFAAGRCRIHPVKPYECRKVFGCEAGRRHKRIRELIARHWR